MKITIIVLLVLSVGIALPLTAQAYIDPGSGSLVLQLLIGSVVGLFVAVKLYWKKIVAFVTLKKASEKDDESI